MADGVAGAIPDSFGTAENLKVFDVKLNSLTAFPSAWTNASYNAINTSYSNIRASFNNISVSAKLFSQNARHRTERQCDWLAMIAESMGKILTGSDAQSAHQPLIEGFVSKQPLTQL